MQDSENTRNDPVKSQVKTIIDTQRKSVDVLTHINNQVKALPHRSILERLSSSSDSNNYHAVIDNFLGDDLCNEIIKEGTSMLDEMELDIEGGGICGEEYVAAIVGGAEQYTSCPRRVN